MSPLSGDAVDWQGRSRLLLAVEALGGEGLDSLALEGDDVQTLAVPHVEALEDDRDGPVVAHVEAQENEVRLAR